MLTVSEFQTAGAEQRKARSAKLVLVVGLQTRGVAEERSRRVTCEDGCDGWGRPDRAFQYCSDAKTENRIFSITGCQLAKTVFYRLSKGVIIWQHGGCR